MLKTLSGRKSVPVHRDPIEAGAVPNLRGLQVCSSLALAFGLLVIAAACGGGGGGGGVSSDPPPSISVSTGPASASLLLGGSQQFTATVTGTSNTAVTWSVNGTIGGNATVGTISTAGLYTAPANLPSPNTVTVSATSQADSTKSASVTVTLAGVAVTVSPLSATVTLGTAQQFSATVTGTSNTAVTWSAGGTAGGNATVGTISATGLYTAPANLPSSNTVTISATSQADNKMSASATVTLVPAASSHSVTVAAGQASSGIDINVGELTPSLQITQVGVGSSAEGTGASVSQGTNASLLLVGPGLVGGTLYSVSGTGDVTVTQPSGADFCQTTDNPPSPCVHVPILVSATAAPGPRNITVTNATNETFVFPGGLLITAP